MAKIVSFMRVDRGVIAHWNGSTRLEEDLRISQHLFESTYTPGHHRNIPWGWDYRLPIGVQSFPNFERCQDVSEGKPHGFKSHVSARAALRDQGCFNKGSQRTHQIRRPNPKATNAGSCTVGSNLPSFMNRSGLNEKGSGYVCSS